MLRRERLALILVVMMGVCATEAWGQPVTITKQSGGTMQTMLASGLVLNNGSSLTREWITLHDAALPADLVGTVGVEALFIPSRDRSEYNYQAKFSIRAREPLTAVQVNFLVFDIFGNHIRTLSSTKIVDCDTGTKDFTPSYWNLLSESEASDYYTSIAYVARVRTKTGRVVQAASGPVLEEAKNFSSKFNSEDLEPEPEKKP